MSKGYVSKKRAKAKRMRRLRKKYKNFSCDTCEKCHNLTCKKRYQATRIGSILVTYYENCDEWKFDKDYVDIPPEKLGIIVLKEKKH